MTDMFTVLLGYLVVAWPTIDWAFRTSSGRVYNRTGSNAEMAAAKLAMSIHARSQYTEAIEYLDGNPRMVAA